MSYQVLARKWRPKTFREMVGQEHVLKALINALDHDRLHHAYLFTGTRGVGKTTIARILVKCLNCEVGVSSVPCGQCSACQEIADGRFVDLIEVDAASRTKVEDTRELLENVQYATTAGRYKVYIIDEVHMLSNSSFNALLKTLEEPPSHVKFLLATTDPQKLPATVLSRCLQFHLKNMSPEKIVGHLQHVLQQEVIEFEEPALWQLGRAAEGSMRDALSLTDQAIAYGSGRISDQDVRHMLGTIDRHFVEHIFAALISLDGAKVLAAVDQLAQYAPDYLGALEELLTLLHRIAIAQAVPEAVDNSFGDAEKISQLAASITAEDVQLFYQMGVHGRKDLSLSIDPRAGFEMLLLRMLAFKPAGANVSDRPALNTAAAATSIQQGEPSPVKKSEAAVQASSMPAMVNRVDSTNSDDAAPVKNSALDAAKALLDKQPEPKNSAKPELAKITNNQQHSNKPEKPKALTETLIKDTAVSTAEVQKAAELAPIAKQQAEIEPIASEHHSEQVGQHSKAIEPNQAIELSQLNAENWPAYYNELNFGGVVGNIAAHCVLEAVKGEHLYFLLDKENATLYNDTYADRMAQHLSVKFNCPIQVTVKIADIQSQTPAMHREANRQEQQKQAIASLQQDENIQLLVNHFDAVLDIDSIRAIND